MDRYDPYTDKFINDATDKNVGTKYDELEIVRAISGLTEWQKHVQTDSNINRDITVAIEALKAQLGTNLAEVGTDLISRKQAIDAVTDELDMIDHVPKWVFDRLEKRLKQLPPAQHEQHLDEWCTDCKEYDTENRCCPRWTKVIRQTRRELQDEFVMTAVDGTLWVTVDDVQKVGRVIVDEEKSKFCKTFYSDGQVEQKWIPVSDKLPDEKGEYLVTYHPCYWDNVYDEIKVGFDTFRGKTKWAKKKHQRVIAWKPIDEPYKPIM